MKSHESVDPLLGYLLKKIFYFILCPFFTKPHQSFIGKNWKQGYALSSFTDRSPLPLECGPSLCTLIGESFYNCILEEPPLGF